MNDGFFQDDIVYYSHPFEFVLWYKPSPGSADHGEIWSEAIGLSSISLLQNFLECRKFIFKWLHKISGVVIARKDIPTWIFLVFLVRKILLEKRSINFRSLGFYNQELSCWRPRGDSIFNELRRFYIGGSNELEDISYVAIPKQFESEKVRKRYCSVRRWNILGWFQSNHPLSRFGFRTVSTGSLNIRLHVVFQSQ